MEFTTWPKITISDSKKKVHSHIHKHGHGHNRFLLRLFFSFFFFICVVVFFSHWIRTLISNQGRTICGYKVGERKRKVGEKKTVFFQFFHWTRMIVIQFSYFFFLSVSYTMISSIFFNNPLHSQYYYHFAYIIRLAIGNWH